MAQAKIQIQAMPQGYRYWLRALGELQWPILPGSKRRVMDSCRRPNSSVHSVANACTSDPLLCWQLSRRANTIIRDREKWPSQLEQMIGLLGLPQVSKIAQNSTEISLDNSSKLYYGLERSLINSRIAHSLFMQLAQKINPQWQTSHDLACLYYQLPAWGLAIIEPKLSLQLEVLEANDTPSNEAQRELLGCRFAEIALPLSQQVPIPPQCRDAWLISDEEIKLHFQQALHNQRLRRQGKPQPALQNPKVLIASCHRLCNNLWEKKNTRQALKLLSGLSGISREDIHKMLHQACISVTDHPAIPSSLHPLRWQLAQWEVAKWLPRPTREEDQPSKTAVGIKLGPQGHKSSPSPESTTRQPHAHEFKQNLKRLLHNDRFSSMAELLNYTALSLRGGLNCNSGAILVFSQGKLKLKKHFGLRESQTNTAAPLELEPQSSPLLMQLLQQAAGTRLQADDDKLPAALRELFIPSQQIALMSVLVGNRPAAMLLIAQDHGVSDLCYKQFKQLSHAFHQSLLRQLKPPAGP